jgi:hypothetical protein
MTCLLCLGLANSDGVRSAVLLMLSNLFPVHSGVVVLHECSAGLFVRDVLFAMFSCLFLVMWSAVPVKVILRVMDCIHLSPDRDQ